MLELKVHDGDEEVTLKFEHSLLSLSKWESRTKRPFLTNVRKPPEELLAYFQDMLVSPEDRPELVYMLEPKDLDRLTNYINDDQTASSVPVEGKPRMNPEVTTSELIYYWMVALKIPFHPTETWHLSRAMMLIQITGYKNQPPKKQKSSDVMQDWIRINNERKKKYNTTG